MSKMTKTGAGWKKTSRGGHEFVSCTIDLPDGKKMRLTMWANKYKEKPNQPDFNFYLADEQTADGAQQAAQAPAPANTNKPDAFPPENGDAPGYQPQPGDEAFPDDDVPF